jgi:hypothetical protein
LVQLQSSHKILNENTDELQLRDLGFAPNCECRKNTVMFIVSFRKWHQSASLQKSQNTHHHHSCYFTGLGKWMEQSFRTLM